MFIRLYFYILIFGTAHSQHTHSLLVVPISRSNPVAPEAPRIPYKALIGIFSPFANQYYSMLLDSNNGKYNIKNGVK